MLDDDQREALDDLDDFTEQTFVSSQYADLILDHMVAWKKEGRSVGIDAMTTWARQREHGEWSAGALAGMALAVEHLDELA